MVELDMALTKVDNLKVKLKDHLIAINLKIIENP